eukprot:scaffold18525_cov190-Cylindrotheca_fusiformis.AAC.6
MKNIGMTKSDHVGSICWLEFLDPFFCPFLALKDRDILVFEGLQFYEGPIRRCALAAYRIVPLAANVCQVVVACISVVEEAFEPKMTAAGSIESALRLLLCGGIACMNICRHK